MMKSSDQQEYRNVPPHFHHSKIPCKISGLLLFLSLLLSFWGNTPLLADVVRFRDSRTRSRNGTITEITPITVSLQPVPSQPVSQQRSGEMTEIEVHLIESIQFDQEPPGFTAIRSAIRAGRFTDALERLHKIDPATITNTFVKQDYDYYFACLTAKVSEDQAEQRPQAIRLLGNFLKNHSKSYHFWDACELLGSLFLVTDQPEKAKQPLEQLGRASWSGYQQQARLMLGHAELQLGNTDRAKSHFESVLRFQEETSESQKICNQATIGLAKCAMRANQADSAVALLKELAATTDSEDSLLQSSISNLLGESYEQLQRPKEAILAYLQTDILYPNVKAERIKALERLAVLWKQTGRADRATQVEQTLKSLK